MNDFYYDFYNEQDDELFSDEEKHFEIEDEESYPTSEEYNRIRKQKYNY
ncbi:MAG: hypothetical protein IJ279_05980 [Clostridia bacterium]|nr:hypothetical protein [Clostridia bacterium]